MSPIAVPSTFAQLQADAIEARDAGIPAAYHLPKSVFPLSKNVTGVRAASGILDESELAITELTTVQLRDAIGAKKYSAVQVARAYCKAAAIAQQVTNCLTELFEPEAIERAQWLDAEFSRTGKPVGEMHGVPVSIKDHIDIKGHDSPSSFLSLRGRLIASEDAQMVAILRKAGAVFFAKTTQPQSLMHLETSCYLGTTVNPYNTGLTSGGSSGGESALIAMKGSCLGIGTDIGGSVRSPAAACGIFSLKPSIWRMPAIGCQMPVGPAGYEGILCTHGPMGRSIEDLQLYLKLVADSKPWLRDPDLQVKPWVESELASSSRKIRIGILESDGVVTPVAAIHRALKAAAAKLSESPDFEVVPYSPILGKEAWEIISKLYWPDKGKMVYDHISKSGEPVLPLTEWIISHSKDNDGTLEESLALVDRRNQFRQAVARHWQESGIDVLLSPVGPTPAPKLETAKYWNYTSYWNIANYPAAVFPSGLYVDPAVDGAEYTATNKDEQWIKETYDAEFSVGAPLSLQLIGYIGHDEDTLAAAKRVVECLSA